MAPDSKTRTGSGPERSSRAGIFEFGLTSTKPLPKPLPNCSPAVIRISQAS